MHHPQYNSSKGNILIVDDCPENLSLLALMLTGYGYKTQLASSGVSALRCVQESPPDLILLDVMMPNMDGYSVCRVLKTRAEMRDIPVIFVSSLQDAENKVQAFSVGAADFVCKPFKVTELVARIEHQIQLVRLQKQLNQQTEQLIRQNQQLQKEIHERKCLEAALQASEDELRGLFSAIQDVVLMLDDAGNYLKVAPTNSAHLLLYKSTDKLEGHSLQETFSPEQAHAFLQQIHLALSGGRTIDYEYNLVIQAQTIWFSAKITPISQDSVIWVARDITDRKLFELEILDKSRSLAIFSRSLKQLHYLQMQDFQSFAELSENFIRSGCQILGFSAGAVGQVCNQCYTFLTVQSEFESLQPEVTVNLEQTFCSKVVQKRATVAFQNIQEIAELCCHPLCETLHLTSYLGTPIFADGQLFGTLCFFSQHPRLKGFEQHEIEIIELMAQSVGKYISAHQLDTQRRQAEEEVQLLLNLTQAIATAPDFNQALDIALQSLCDATGWSYGQVWLPAADGQMLECSPIWHYRGNGPEGEGRVAPVEQFHRAWQGATCRLGEGIAGQIWSHQQAQWVPDVQAHGAAGGDAGLLDSLQTVREHGFHAYFGVPVVVVRDRYFDAAPPMHWGRGGNGDASTFLSSASHNSLLAVLVFFMETPQPQDQRFTELVPGITAQLGTVLLQKQVEAELKALLVAMTDVIVVLDAQGRCLKMVPNHPSLHASPREMLGKTLHETLPLPIAELMLGGIERSLTTRRTVDVEYSLPVQGREVCFLSRISPLSGESVIMVARDITQRKQVEAALQDSEERFRTIFEQAAVGIFLTDITGQFIRVNQCLCRILDYTEFELLNLSFQDVIHPEDRARSQAYLQQVLEGEGSGEALEIRCVCKPGRSRWVSLTLSLMRQSADRSAYLIAVAEDIQERKQIELDLQAAKDAAMREATRSADANRTKSEFLANISHELRTPLNAILGFTQLLAREATFSAKNREYLDIVSRSGAHLLDLINDVLELSKIEAGRSSLKLSPFDLHYFLRELEEMLRLNAEAKGLQFLFDYGADVPQYVEADEGKLRQVLINLLGNAIKFTSEGGVTLRVRVTGTEQGGGSAQEACRNPFPLFFEVEDTGIGIAPPDLETLFDPFVQSKQRTPQPEGTGLGLPISQKFVELMGGTIRVDSTPGQGTLCRFSIQVLPTQRVEPPRPAASQRAIALLPDQPVYRVLVVDDHPPSRQLLVNLLQGVGFVVEEATDGEAAIAHWQRWKPHLIWMDMRMPLVDGYEATRRIRAVEATQEGGFPRTKIIAVTASAFEEDRARVLAAGCDDFVRKPFRDDRILEAMAAHLGVGYRYAQASTVPLPLASLPQDLPSLDEATLQFMPPDWIQQVHQAAIRGSDEQLLHLIEQIPGDHASLIQVLKNWVLDYQFDRLLTLTQGITQ